MKLITCLLGVVALLACAGCATGRGHTETANAGGGGENLGETTLYGQGQSDPTDYKNILADPGPF